MELTYTAGLRYLCREGVRNLRIEQGNKTFVNSRDIRLNHISLLSHRAFWRFTEYCTTTNALIVYHILVQNYLHIKTLSLLLHVSIALCISSSGSTYISWLKSLIKIMSISLWWMMWQHHVSVCALFLVQGVKWTGYAPWWWYAKCYRNV
jgi:hypothetical protein